MSKRYIPPQQNGIRKKAKLDITVSDHNFPLSQNTEATTETNENDFWDDEIDDEVVLLASQAYEKSISGHNKNELPNYSVCMNPPSTSTQIQTKPSGQDHFQFKEPSSKLTSTTFNDNYERNSPLKSSYNKCINNNENSFLSELPNYSICMDPSSTSTQKQPEPSTSRNCFQFKKPSTNQVFNSVSTKLNDKCEKISSPLRAMSKVCKTDNVNISDDLIFNNMISKGQDSDQVYRQLLQLKEENEKLKSENGKLLEKCVTKEGEASILRTQLKTCQIAVDNARMDKIKAQEKVQMDWSEKLSLKNKQLSELRTQLDFKNLEIISVKEKCKLLESNKVRLTQVKVGNEYGSQSYNNRSGIIDTQTKRVKKVSSAVQTDGKSHFLKLNISFNREYTKLTEILPLVMDQTCKQFSILEYNEKLKQQDSSDKCRIYTTFHKLPITSHVKRTRKMFNLSCLYEDLSHISTSREPDIQKCLHIVRTARDVLEEVYRELENVQQRVTTAFIKEMDDVYMEASQVTVTAAADLLRGKYVASGRSLYKEEQGVQARRVTAVLVYILDDSQYREVNHTILDDNKTVTEIFIDLFNKICLALDHTSTSTLYSGLLLSMTLLLNIFMKSNAQTMDVIKNIILSRPMGFVICEIIKQIACYQKTDIYNMCRKNGGNLKLDHEQGVLFYRKDCCILWVVLEQLEAAIRCIEKQYLVTQAVECCRCILKLYSTLNTCDEHENKSRCECRGVLMQVMVYTLKICAQMWTEQNNSIDVNESLRAVCQYGVQVLYLVVSADTDSLTQHEGPLIQTCHMMRTHCEEMYSNMISEIISTFQSATEEIPHSYNKQAWINSFQTFNISE